MIFIEELSVGIHLPVAGRARPALGGRRKKDTCMIDFGESMDIWMSVRSMLVFMISQFVAP